MTTFHDLNSLFNHIEKASEKAVRRTIGDVERRALDNIEKYVYNTSNSEYVNTFQLRNSLSSSFISNTRGVFSGSLVLDGSNTEYYSDYDGSSVNGNDLYGWINDGRVSSALYGEGFWTEPRPFIDKTNEYFNTRGLSIFSKYINMSL